MASCTAKGPLPDPYLRRTVLLIWTVRRVVVGVVVSAVWFVVSLLDSDRGLKGAAASLQDVAMGVGGSLDLGEGSALVLQEGTAIDPAMAKAKIDDMTARLRVLVSPLLPAPPCWLLLAANSKLCKAGVEISIEDDNDEAGAVEKPPTAMIFTD